MPAPTSLTPKNLGVNFFSNVDTTIYTCPASTIAIIRTISVLNTDSVARTFSISLVPNGQANGDKYRLAKTFSLNANDLWEEASAHVLGAGDTVIGSASVTGVVNCRVDGAEAV